MDSTAERRVRGSGTPTRGTGALRLGCGPLLAVRSPHLPLWVRVVHRKSDRFILLEKHTVMKPIITSSHAHLDNQAEMAQFLAPIPNAAELAKVLAAREPITTRAFEDEVFTARFVASDGSVVHCHTIPDITIDQAEMIAVACEGNEDRSGPAFRAVVESV